MPGEIDLSALSKEQLIQLVQVRGQALQFGWEIDRRFTEKMTGPDFQASDFDAFVQEKQDLALKFGIVEEKIIGGTGQTAN
jgi:hypothetical protein